MDAASGDDDAAEDYANRRGVYLSPVGEGWDLRGWLPGVEGAQLAGIVNEYMSRAHRTTDTDTDTGGRVSAAARRADALMDIARAAAADLPDTARQRAAVTILIPAHQLPTNPNTQQDPKQEPQARRSRNRNRCRSECRCEVPEPVPEPTAGAAAGVWCGAGGAGFGGSAGLGSVVVVYLGHR